MKKKTKETTTNKGLYKATVQVLGRKYESSGKSISEAINGLKPQNCKGRAILVIDNGEVKKERILMPRVSFRLFNTMGFSKEIALKQASTLFQGL